MSRGPENTFMASVHRYLPPVVYHMKNHNPYVGGIPDVWYSGRRGDLWVEWKYVTMPKRPSTVIDLVGGKNPPLTPLQQQWLRERAEEGRNVAVIIGSKQGGVMLTHGAWMTSFTAAYFAAHLISRKDLAERIVEEVHG